MVRYKYIKSKALILLIVALILPGCGLFGNKKATMEEELKSAKPQEEILRYTGEKSAAISSVYTTKKELTLTFNGMGDAETMEKLLSELDIYNIKATFFLPGMRVAEEPEIAKEIISRGHEIENNTLNELDMRERSYEEIYKEIQLSNEIIQKETGIKPRYVRTRSGDYSDDIRLVAAQLGMAGVVSYNINPRDRDMQDAKTLGEYVKRYISRGGIVSLNTNINPEVIRSIAYMVEAAEEIGYKYVPLSTLIENGSERRPLSEIEGFDAVRVNPDYENAESRIFHKANTNKKVVALTFDDWASDQTVTKVLDILAEYDVKSTFFLIGRGVENNPNLARAILDEGHEVASHSYTHQIVTTMTPTELQEDLVRAHEVLTEAIQEQPTMLFRPATGAIDEESAKIITATGYPIIALYDVTTFDWDVNNRAEDILDTVMTRAEAGSVIVTHILDDTHIIEALPTVIESLRAKGYSFAKMSDLIDLNTD